MRGFLELIYFRELRGVRGFLDLEYFQLFSYFLVSYGIEQFSKYRSFSDFCKSYGTELKLGTGVTLGVGVPPNLVPTGGTALTAVEVGVKRPFLGFWTCSGGRSSGVAGLSFGYVVTIGKGKSYRQVAGRWHRPSGRKVSVKSAKTAV